MTAATLQELAAKQSIHREGKPFSHEEAEQYLRILPGWTIKEDTIEKEYRFTSYLEGLDFGYAVGKIAEEQDHHPDILVRWRRVKLTLSTHSVKGLSENDFILAARADLKYQHLAVRRD